MPKKNKERAAWNEMESGYTEKNFQPPERTAR